MAEHYPMPKMVDWLWIIGVGLVLLGVMLGGMFNIFMLTYKERISKVALEFGMSPRPLPLMLLPKMVLALCIALLIGTILMGILYFWLGICPGAYIGAVYLICCLVALFWISLMLVIGLRARHHMAGAIGMVMTGVIVFFTCGALSMVRYLSKAVLWFAQIFPNTHAIDPLRELILFHQWPSNWTATLVILSVFAVVGVTFGLIQSRRQLRRVE
jgi:ABC-type multidrug transport system permease subunit